MAKRSIRTTDPDSSNPSGRRRSSAPDQNGTAPKPTRGRRKTDGQDASSPLASVADIADFELSHDAIAERAYHIYLERGATPGDPFQDWLTAERELRQRLVVR